MCGIFGVWHQDSSPIEQAAIQRALTSIRHRGPDDEGYLFVNTDTGSYLLAGGRDTPREVFSSDYLYSPKRVVTDLSSEGGYNLALANRRLAIIDLSPAGHQPMCNEDGTVWIVHNGEIYNFRELREELKSQGHRFVSDTDTEVIVNAYEEWGANCLSKFNGMWAFCIWDSRQRKLFCSRDRFGIKPFYYYFDGNRFLFASEIKSLLQANIPVKVNSKMVYDYLAYTLVDHCENTFFEGIKQLRGGHFLEIQVDTGKLGIDKYWDLGKHKVLPPNSAEEYVSRFRALLEDSVCLRLISDVPLGTCLSGGIDSSAIVCLVDRLMREQGVKIPGSDIQKAFSARYDDSRHDEGFFINHVVKKAHVEAHQTYPSAEYLWSELAPLIYHQEEPFPSTSIYAQWCVFKLVSESNIKVTLDGQGADELLAGYHGYFADYFGDLVRSFHWIELVKEFSSFARRHPASVTKNLLKLGSYQLPPRIRFNLERTMRFTGHHWMNSRFVRKMEGHDRTSTLPSGRGSIFDSVLYDFFTTSHLPSLLRYEDRNAMAHSIESRLPFLDVRLVELTFALPRELKISSGVTKQILRQSLQGILPESIRVRQDKIGFTTPEDTWFRSCLKDQIKEILHSESFAGRGYLNVGKVKQAFDRFCKGRTDISREIWRWVNLELWLRRFID